MMNGNLIFSFWFLFLCIAALTCDALQGDHLTRLMNAKKVKNIDHQRSLHVQNVELAQAFIAQEGPKETDKIQRLPRQLNKVNFTQYGGYVTVDEQAGRALFYYFAEVNGADCCMGLVVLSLRIGAFRELEPFQVHSDGKTLYENIFALNKAANMLFLESPAGVGFSYANTTSDYDKNGDNATTVDNYVFLVNWLERYPEHKRRDFYLVGESYAGALCASACTYHYQT